MLGSGVRNSSFSHGSKLLFLLCVVYIHMYGLRSRRNKLHVIISISGSKGKTAAIGMVVDLVRCVGKLMGGHGVEKRC